MPNRNGKTFPVFSRRGSNVNIASLILNNLTTASKFVFFSESHLTTQSVVNDITGHADNAKCAS